MKRLSERQIINLISKTLGIGKKRTLWNDDVATMPFGSKFLVFKCDMFVLSTDAPRQMSLSQMARKSIVSSLSDLACKGVRPLATLVSIAIPKDFTEKNIAAIANGFRIAEREFNVNIIGGDTNEGKELVIDCCMIGLCDHIVKRSGARNGDLIVTSGAFGYSASGLKILTRKTKTNKQFRNKAVRAVLMPKPRLEFGELLARYATSSMDSSDGLAITLHELSRQSRRMFVMKELPATKEIREFAKRNRYNFNELILHGGEEYEIVATIPKRYLTRVKHLARKTRCKLFVLGTVAKGSGVFILEKGKRITIERRGWEHLSKTL
ncbi:MAG: thiamine-monophosphate kinase [Candidatus Nitrosomirales archaeon]|jgi:thiamine-monophosphate kinase